MRELFTPGMFGGMQLNPRRLYRVNPMDPMDKVLACRVTGKPADSESTIDLIFVADLMRAIHAPLEIDFLAVSSYGAATKSSGVVRIIKDLDHDVAGRDVILVEDIVDSGLTLRYLLDHLSSQRPASLRTCSLLVREDVPEQPEIDYVGFTLPPAFVIGYGLDVAQQYRHLPYIASYAKA